MYEIIRLQTYVQPQLRRLPAPGRAESGRKKRLMNKAHQLRRSSGSKQRTEFCLDCWSVPGSRHRVLISLVSDNSYNKDSPEQMLMVSVAFQCHKL